METERSHTAFVVSQGEELLTGVTVDTNAAYLCSELTLLGLRVQGRSTAGDRIEAIADCLQRAAASAETTICTGGLGPTEDDLTAEAAGRAFGLEIELSAEALGQVEERYRRIGRAMAATNRRQAMLPRSARVICNRLGTAPGFALSLPTGQRLYFLPGVPFEMKAMWSEFVAPELRDDLHFQPPRRALFRVMGRGESQLQELLAEVPRAHPGVELGFRTAMPENQVKLTTEDAAADFTAAVDRTRELLGRNCFSEDEDSNLAAVVGRALVDRGERLTLAESCTGGWIGHLCVSEPGSSQWLERGFVTYSNTAKIEDLGVPLELLEEHGAVAEETASAMAEGAARSGGTAWGLAVTGIAGPSGGSEDKPVGTVCIAVSGPGGIHVRRLAFADRGRTLVRKFSAYAALDMLRRQLLRLD